MKKVYLRNGEEVIFHREIDKENFIIERIMIYYDYEGREETEPSGTKELVKEIYLKVPIEKKQDELICVLGKIETKNNELTIIEKQIFVAKNELRKSEEYKTDLAKHIINKRELLKAEKITVFCDYKPYVLSEKEKQNLKISFTIEVRNGEQSAWAYEIFESGSYGNSTHVNPKYGLIINASDDEILRIGKEIVSEAKNISDWDLRRRVPDEYLTDELLKRKKELGKVYKQSEIKKLEDEISTKKEKLQELKTK